MNHQFEFIQKTYSVYKIYQNCANFQNAEHEQGFPKQKIWEDKLRTPNFISEAIEHGFFDAGQIFKTV